jgi:hypothetical protein
LRYVACAAVCIAGLVAPGPVAGADEPPRIREYVHQFTSTAPGAASGLRLRVDHVNPSDPEGKPPALVHELVELHPGTVFDTFAVPRCSASDQELQALGPAACPSEAFVGSGEIHLDTGAPGPGRIQVNDVTLINAANELVVLLEGRGSPAPVRLVVRGRAEGNTLDVPIPSAPGADGPTPTFEVLTFDERSTVVDGRRLNYITTPRECPAGGHWTNHFTFTFWDGVAQTFASPSPCEAQPVADARAPRIRIRGIPHGGCLRRDFRLRAGVVDRGSGLRLARLYLDGRLLRQTSRMRFRAHIRVRGLEPRRHRLTLTASDRAGNWAALRARFRRCEARGRRRVTGSPTPRASSTASGTASRTGSSPQPRASSREAFRPPVRRRVSISATRTSSRHFVAG